MSRILKVSNGDYKLQVRPSGNIILDTQSTDGTVKIIGKLDVVGQLTYIESTNTQISDNILQLNVGQTGNGVGGGTGYSGIEIERGNYSPAQFLFDETITYYDTQDDNDAKQGVWSIQTAAGVQGALQVRTITNDGLADIGFDLQHQNPVLRVVNADDAPAGPYYLRVTDANHIPNLEYLQNYVASTYTNGVPGVAIVDRIYFPLSGTIGAANASIQADTTSIVFKVAQTTRATITSNGVDINNISLVTITISNTSSNNLVLTAQAGKNIQLTSVAQLDDQASAPTYASGNTQIYSSATAGPGRTGVYFANSTSFGLSTGHEADELISRNRAVLLSILL
jgi:hypothetical protein